MAEEMSAEEQVAALEGFLGNPVAVAYAKGHSAAQDVIDAGAEMQDELRQLVSYCRTQAEEVRGHFGSTPGSQAYNDVADKLSAILDGE